MNSIKKLLIFTVILLIFGVLAYGQTISETAGTVPSEIGVDTAQQKLKEISISKFEDSGLWSVFMNREEGVATSRRLSGGHSDKVPIPDEVQLGFSGSDKYVLGVRVDYTKRGFNQFEIKPAKPLAVEGIVKTLSLWVVGRNSPHTLMLLISDQFGNKAEITMGTLNFSGWKKMTVAIPPTIKQYDYHYINRMGIRIEGFRVDCDPEETRGTYFFYLDDLRAVTDLFAEENRDPDDMLDNW